MFPEYEPTDWDRVDGPIYWTEIAPLLPAAILDFHLKEVSI